MATTHPDSTLLFRVPTEKQSDEIPNGFVEDETEEEASEEEHILCRQCHNVLTSLNEQIELQGSQKHTFANPHGIVFEIGCFRAVMGCGYAGPASDEFSWFKGFSWRAAVCVMCLTHLGWLFESRSGSSFHGLILDRLLFR